MQQFERAGDGDFDLAAMLAQAVGFLKSGGLAPVDGPDGGRKNSPLAAMLAKLAQDGHQLVFEGSHAQLRVPKTE